MKDKDKNNVRSQSQMVCTFDSIKSLLIFSFRFNQMFSAFTETPISNKHNSLSGHE